MSDNGAAAMTALTDEQLADLRARITPGLWRIEHRKISKGLDILADNGDLEPWGVAYVYGHCGPGDATPANAEAMRLVPDLLDEVVRLREALAPFSRMAGLLFSINKNSPDVVLSVKARSGEDQLTAGDFFAARRALTTEKNDG